MTTEVKYYKHPSMAANYPYQEQALATAYNETCFTYGGYASIWINIETSSRLLTGLGYIETDPDLIPDRVFDYWNIKYNNYPGGKESQKKVCKNCNKTFNPKKDNQEYCNVGCRLAYARKVKHG